MDLGSVPRSGRDLVYYVIGRFICRVVLKLFFRYRVEGHENVPRTGGVLLVANHANYLDPPLLGSSVERHVHFMAKAELFKIPVLGWILPRVKAFPVARGGSDRGAVRHALRILESGGVVGIFPEGTRTRTGEMLPFQRGAGLIATRANATVVPMALIGTYRPMRGRLIPRRFVVRIGPPIDLNAGGGEEEGKKGAADRANRLMLAGIERLMREDPS